MVDEVSPLKKFILGIGMIKVIDFMTCGGTTIIWNLRVWCVFSKYVKRNVRACVSLYDVRVYSIWYGWKIVP